MKVYITFGQDHTWLVDGNIIDKDCVAVIECEDHATGRARAFELFGRKFSFCQIPTPTEEEMQYYSRGFFEMPVKGEANE